MKTHRSRFRPFVSPPQFPLEEPAAYLQTAAPNRTSAGSHFHSPHTRFLVNTHSRCLFKGAL